MPSGRGSVRVVLGYWVATWGVRPAVPKDLSVLSPAGVTLRRRYRTRTTPRADTLLSGAAVCGFAYNTTRRNPARLTVTPATLPASVKHQEET